MDNARAADPKQTHLMLPALLADPHPLPERPLVPGPVHGERHAVRRVGVRRADHRVQHRQRLLAGEGGPEEAVLVVAGVTLKDTGLPDDSKI